jgi:predicted kinase
MTKFYMMVGLPASGKSTYAKLLAEEVDGIVVSSDGIRAEWYGDEAIQGDPSKIFREVELRCKNALGAGQSVVMDATNMNAKKRTNFLRQLPACYKACVVMAVPFDVCIARDEVRPRHVGPEVMEKMRKNFQMPYYNEGWDHIEVYYPKDCEMIDADAHYRMEVEFDQRNSHHSLTVGDHEWKAECIAREKGFDSAVQTAAAFHDCGKIWCQYFKEGDPEAHYYGHECVSAYQYLTMETAEMIYAVGNKVQVIAIAALITWHMVPYPMPDECPYDSLKEWGRAKGFDEQIIEHLWQLHQCDVGAH